MTNLIIVSEQRVGSRWMHYLFCTLLNKNPSPEIDGNKVLENLGTIEQYFKDNRIVKFHRTTPNRINNLMYSLFDYNILGVVRNPRDRAVSLAFHNRYHKKHNFKQKEFETDQEAVTYTVFSKGFREENDRQLMYLMTPWRSTKTRHLNTFWSVKERDTTSNYIWTSYEWLKFDTFKEVKAICDYFKFDVSDRDIENAVQLHEFKHKSGREVGEEKREDLWRRKGIVGDWSIWLGIKELEVTKSDYNSYYYRLYKEEIENVSSN